MEVYIRALFSIFKYLKYKFLYRDKAKIGFPQSWGKRYSLAMEGKNAKAIIGRKNVTRDNVTIRVKNGRSEIGDKCFFNSNVSITCVESIKIGSNCQFANNVVIVDHDHVYRMGLNPELISSAVNIGNNVWVGANVVILRGSIIGDNAVIAAGSVVRGVIPPNNLFYQKRTNYLKKYEIMGEENE